ncbi:MAG TPA: ADOP family duplicated permease [Acidobacteriota bacterium]|nr:ADOP family duplicated permease [Acidobacteriota bacterium]
MTDLMHDLRFALRLWLRRPGMAVAALLLLGLGIGANAALFSLARGLLFLGPALQEPQRIAFIWRETDRLPDSPFSIPTYRDLEERQRSFESLALFVQSDVNLTQRGQAPERLTGLQVSAGFAGALGVQAVEGRLLTPRDDRLGADPAAVISESLWMRRWGGDPSAVGQVISLNGRQYTVVGVYPSSLVDQPLGPYRGGDVWLPIGLFFDRLPVQEREVRPGTFAVARLLPSVDMQSARADVERIGREIAQENPLTNSKSQLRLEALEEDLTGPSRPLVAVLALASGFVLLIACFNLFGLLSARTALRRHEFAMRAVLGAGPGRLLRQLTVENLLLAAGGSLLGLLLAQVLLALPRSSLQLLGRPEALLRVDAPVIAASLVLGLVCGFLVSLPHAGRAFLQAEGHLLTSHRSVSRGLAGWVISAQMAAALALTAGAFLMLATLWRLGGQELGFEPQRVLSLQVTLPAERYADPQTGTRFFDEALQRVRSLPGVDEAAVSSLVPLAAGTGYLSIAAAGDRPLPPVPEMGTTLYQTGSPDFFRLLGMRLRSGRLLEERDDGRRQGERAAVINAAMVRQFWPDAQDDPVGETIAFEFAGTPRDPQPQYRRIVGVVEDARQSALDQEPQPTIYTAYRQPPLWFQGEWPSMALLLKTSLQAELLAPAVHRQLLEIDPELPIHDVQLVSEAVRDGMGQPRLLFQALGAFALLAVILSSLGLFATARTAVAARTREIGTRVALGATPRHIVSQLQRRSLPLIALGLLLGLAGAAGVGQMLSSLLFGTAPLEPLPLLAAALVLALSAWAATLLPAYRAARSDPARALRVE